MARNARRIHVSFLAMRMHESLDGIVLRTYDVGEADRLCVLLTRERGRLAARARAVRKLGSRMGSLLLPGRRVQLDVEGEYPHLTITAARLLHDIADLSQAQSFASAQHATELLLLFTEDGEPLADVFDLFCGFMRTCSDDPAKSRVPFQLRLFHLLGFLPSHEDDQRFAVLSKEGQASVRLCMVHTDFDALRSHVGDTPELRTFLRSILVEHARRDLRSEAVLTSLSS